MCFFFSFWLGAGRRDSCLDMFHTAEHSTVACIILARQVKRSREENETLCARKVWRHYKNMIQQKIKVIEKKAGCVMDEKVQRERGEGVSQQPGGEERGRK